ncbi:hypothetical protein O181_064049 [Austropuccinia psidii MF-1]|uniref:Uncharacterized protein n=1 Tax=Austropuccinia psidii MF-1 TaxID=1389203 RepID=A0A9Q3I356_9BASI|nr:hypothetical protein [Austropuccinia psidii MF-1]
MFYGLWSTPPFTGHILNPFASLTNSSPHHLPGQYLCFGPGGPSGLPGASGSLAPPLSLWGFRPKWPFWAIQATYGLYGLPTTNPIGKVGPKPQVGPSKPILTLKNGQIDPRTQIGHSQPPVATRSSSASFPLDSGERLSFTNVLHIKDLGMVNIWYNIPLCTNFAQQSNGDGFRTKLCHFKSITHFEGSIFIHSVLQSLVATRRPFKNPYHLALQELGCIFFSGLFRGKFQEVIKHPISCQGIKYFSIPWTPQLVHTGCIQASCMALALFGQFIFHCGNSITQFNSQDCQIFIDPKQSMQPRINPPGSVFSFSHILATFSSLGTFSPVN